LAKKLSGDDVIYEKMTKLNKAKIWLLLPAIYLAYPLVPILSKNSNYIISIYDIIQIIMAIVVIWVFLKIDNEDTRYKIRCKYCGSYTYYINPNEDFALMHSNNNCSICGRMYPMPSKDWDTFQGQLYIYDRGSVTDKEFYEEFEKEHPEIPKSKAADHYLGRKEV